MTATFLILAALTIAGTAAAMGLRNAVHCVLALTLGFAGLSALYLQLGAQFVGLTQILVYVGAVAILAVFAIMMTQQPTHLSKSTSSLLLVVWAVSIAAAGLCRSRLGDPFQAASLPGIAAAARRSTVQQIGDALMHQYVLPLEIMGLLLTAALIGAVIIAMHEKRRSE